LQETSVLGRWLVGSLAIAMFFVCAPLGAQRQRPLAPLPPGGLRVAPFFDGWYANPDGTVTLSFGYSNPNREEVVEIPLGPDNFIEPKEYDGRQPTSFPPAVPDATGAGRGRGSDRRDRERGVFTVTVPAGFQGDVVWTLRNRGQTVSVPGRTKTGAYGLRWPMAMGSIPPLLRFKADGPAGRGPVGIQADPVQASVGAPLSLTIWITDDSKREKDPIQIKERDATASKAAMNVTWYKHSGPGPVVFSPPKEPIADLQGTATTSATFKQPGEYAIRVRADNFGRVDTSAGNQCCWTNGYVKVTVTP
jgi:hypothetical protein